MPKRRRRDHRRSRYIRVSDTIFDESWDNDVVASFVRLLGYLRQRWAREKLEPEEGSRARISPTDAMKITGKRRLDVALKLLGSLSEVVSMSLEREGDIAVIDWPNVAEFQEWEGLRARAGPASDGRSGSRRTARDSRRKKQERPAVAVVPEDSPEFRFASDFRTALVRVHEGFKSPADQAFLGWVKSARLLIAERTEAEARLLAKWLFDATSNSERASFWRGVVLSVPKFRARFDQMSVQRRAESEARERRPVRAGSPEEAVANLAQRFANTEAQ
jgi:hypothetical protein